MSLLKTMGGGIANTTLQPTPFHNYTKTPDVKNERMSPKDANTALPTIDENKVAPPPKHRGNGAPPPVSTMQLNLGAKLRDSSFVARLDAGNTDDPGKNYRALLDNPAYFNFGNASATPSQPGEASSASQSMVTARADLEEQLEAVHTHLGDNQTLPSEMKGAEMMVVTQAVALACKGMDPHLAGRGLACLREVDLHASIANPETSRPDGFNEDEFASAWRIAHALEQTPLGFAALKKIAQPAYDVPNPHASITSHDDTMLHVYLKASREKTRLDPALPAHPQAVLGNIPDNPGTLLDKSLRAVQSHLTQSVEHARNDPAAAFTARKDANEWTIGAVRNGFYTDAQKDANGKSTPFYKAENRLKKMSKWVSRANGTGNSDPGGSVNDAIGARTSKVKKFTRFMRNTLLPGMKKSPFNALNRQAPDTLPFVGATSGSGFRNVEGGGLGEARAIKSMIDNLEKALAANGASLAPREADPDADTLEGMVRLAILKQVKADTKILPRYVNIGLDDSARTQVKEHVYAALQGNVAGQSQATKDAINRLIDNQHTNLTPETLGDWANHAGCPASVPDAAQLASDQPDWRAFRLAQRRATEQVRPTETPDLKTITKANTARMLEEHTRNHELGSRVVMYSGGIGGVGTKQLSALISKVVSKTLLRAHVDVRAEGTRCATIEIGTGAQGNELFLGTQGIKKGQAGGGVSIGWNISDKNDDAVVSASVGAAASIGMEGTDRNGVLIRFDRLKGGVVGDQENNAKLARLAGKLSAPDALPEGQPYANAQGDDAASPLKNLWQEWPEVSVSLLETKEKAGRAGASVSGGLGLKIGKFGMGLPGIGAGVDGKKGKGTWKETGGSLHVDKQTKYWTAKTSVSAAVASFAGGVGTSNEDVGLSLTGGEPLGGAVDFWRNGYAETDTFIEYEGELKKSTVKIKSYQTAKAFVDNVAPHLDEWAEAKTKRFNPGEYGAAAPEDETPPQEAERLQRRDAAIEAEHTKLSQHLQRALDLAEPTQSFWEFKEITQDATAAANALKSLAVMAEGCGDKQALQECTESRKKLLKSEEAWEPSFLVDYETTAQQRSMTPVNFFFKSGQLDGISTSNIRTFN
jgi:hypothetical protein